MHFGKKRRTRRFRSKCSQRNIQKFRNKENTIGLYMSHLILQTSRRGWALVISKTPIYSAGSQDPSKESRSGWGEWRWEGTKRKKKRIASGKNSIHVHSKHLFRSCLHRRSQYFQGHYQLLGFCSAPGEAWREWKLVVNFQFSWEIRVVLL